jgi:hypothetical protein
MLLMTLMRRKVNGIKRGEVESLVGLMVAKFNLEPKNVSEWINPDYDARK